MGEKGGHKTAVADTTTGTYAFFFAGECERIQGESIKSTSNPAVRFITQKVPIGPVALLCPCVITHLSYFKLC